MRFIKALSIWVSLLVIITITSCQYYGKSTSMPYEIAYTSKESGNIEIYLGENDGKSNIKSTNNNGGYVAWSPDGKRIAFYAKYDERKTWSIHTMNRDGTNKKRLTHVKDYWDNSPTWSPDGSKIAFARAYKDSSNVRQYEIWIMNADGTNQQQIKGLSGGGPHFTLDGSILFHSQPNPSDIFIADMDGGNLVQLTHNGAEDWHPEVSPDDTQVAFMSDRDSVHQIYTMNIDGSNQKQLTNQTFDCWYPSWSPDGAQLIFVTGDPDKEERLIYVMNKDGSGMRKIIDNGSQVVWLKRRQ